MVQTYCLKCSLTTRQADQKKGRGTTPDPPAHGLCTVQMKSVAQRYKSNQALPLFRYPAQSPLPGQSEEFAPLP